MNGCPPDEPTLQRFIAEIAVLLPRPHHSALLTRANELLPECEFRHVLSRGGWYRPGGVVAADGERLSDDIEAWAEAQSDDPEWLESLTDLKLMVTRHAGKTHYFVACYGAAPADFLQLEVEELQEVIDRLLINPESPPADLAELLEPLQAAALDAQAVAAPYYRFRRLTDMRQVMLRQPLVNGEASPLTRFMEEWQRRAAPRFSAHWIVGLREHQDRYRNKVVSASPVSLAARKLKSFHWVADVQGLALADQIHAFDRAAGYVGAWYFHMVAGGLVPRDVAYAAARDLEAGFDYLAEADEKLLAGWLDKPYAV